MYYSLFNFVLYIIRFISDTCLSIVGGDRYFSGNILSRVHARARRLQEFVSQIRQRILFYVHTRLCRSALLVSGHRKLLPQHVNMVRYDVGRTFLH